MTTAAAVPARRSFILRGWHVLAITVSFFAIVVGFDTWFAVLAMRTFPGEVSKTAYEDGLKYNQTLDARDAQAGLGWRLAVDPGTKAGVLRVRAVDATGAPLEALRLTGVLTRPATVAGQISTPFKLIAPGLYEADTTAGAGAWDVKLSAKDASGHSFNAERRLSWR